MEILWNLVKFARLKWNRFCLLAGESVERLPPTHTTNFEKAYQELCESLLYVAKQSIPRGHRKNCVRCWDRECETFQRSLFEPQWGLTLTEQLRPYVCGSTRRSRNVGMKLSIPSTSCTPAAKHGAPSTKILAGPDPPLVCALPQQIPPLHNSWRMEHTRQGTASQKGSSTGRCPTAGMFLPASLCQVSMLQPSPT